MADANRKPVIVWFRNDLRTADNAALCSAADTGRPVICLWIRNFDGPVRAPGAAQTWWLNHSLTALAGKLANLGVQLVLRSGNSASILDTLINETGASSVYWNRRYDPAAIPLDTSIKTALRDKGIEVRTFDGQLLHEPTQVRTGSGTPFKVFTPFWRTVRSGPEPRLPYPAPLKLSAFGDRIQSERLEDWNFLPTKPDWAGGMREEWKPGENGAFDRLADFIEGALDGYAEDRNVPGRVTTSKLSPHLAMGEITPYQLWHAVSFAYPASGRDVEKFRSEVGWREFAYHLLFHFPKLANDNFNAGFDPFPWARPDPSHLNAWQKGSTGYPIVDAGMRELWASG